MKKWDIREALFGELPFGENEKAEIVRIGIKRLIRIHGVKQVLDYSDKRIGLAMKKGRVNIEGEELSCITYVGGAIGIEGKIICISFSEDGK